MKQIKYRTKISLLLCLQFWAPASNADSFITKSPTAYTSSVQATECEQIKRTADVPIIVAKKQACEQLAEQQREIESKSYEYTSSLCYSYQAKRGFIAKADLDSERLQLSTQAWHQITKYGLLARFDEQKKLRNLIENNESFFYREKRFLPLRGGIRNRIIGPVDINDPTTYEVKQITTGINFGDKYGSNFTHFLTASPGYYYALERCLGQHFSANDFSAKYDEFNKFTQAIRTADIIKGGMPVEMIFLAAEYAIGIKAINWILKGHRRLGSPISKLIKFFTTHASTSSTLAVLPIALTSSQPGPSELQIKQRQQRELDIFSESIQDIQDDRVDLSPLHLSQLSQMLHAYKISKIIQSTISDILIPLEEDMSDNLDIRQTLAQQVNASSPEQTIIFNSIGSCITESNDPQQCLDIAINAYGDLAAKQTIDWQIMAQSQIDHIVILQKFLQQSLSQGDDKNAELLEDCLAIIEQYKLTN